jgi:hypothetical protein
LLPGACGARSAWHIHCPIDNRCFQYQIDETPFPGNLRPPLACWDRWPTDIAGRIQHIAFSVIKKSAILFNRYEKKF